MELRELQIALQARVLERRAGIESTLIGSERLHVYTDGYRSRLIEALGVAYPALKSTLGEAEFERVMHAYVEVTPSRHTSIRNYGSTLAEWFSARQAPVLADLARWEWTLAEVFDAADDEAASVAELGAVAPGDWPGVTFAFRRSMRRVVLRSNAVQHWRAAQDTAPRPEDLQTAAPVDWLLWRQGLRSLFRSLDPDEAAALQVAVDGANFGSLCECLAESHGTDAAPARAALLLQRWFADELIARVSQNAVA